MYASTPCHSIQNFDESHTFTSGNANQFQQHLMKTQMGSQFGLRLQYVQVE